MNKILDWSTLKDGSPKSYVYVRSKVKELENNAHLSCPQPPFVKTLIKRNQSYYHNLVDNVIVIDHYPDVKIINTTESKISSLRTKNYTKDNSSNYYRVTEFMFLVSNFPSVVLSLVTVI